MAPPLSSSTSASGQPHEHISSSPSPLSFDHSSLPSVSHTNALSISKEETPSVRDALASEAVKAPQTGFPFLSLPPEIRNMIYHYLFAPVRDGTCLQVHTDPDVTRLKGTRKDCYICASRLAHKTCQSSILLVEHMSFAFQYSGNSARSGILQTCKMVMEEALPISLACIHINMICGYVNIVRLRRPLKLFLTYLRQPGGCYLSVFSITYHETLSGGEDVAQHFSQLINEAGIRIGQLILSEVSSGSFLKRGRFFAATLDYLDHKPTRVEWTRPFTKSSDESADQRVEFNAAAERWLAELAKIKVPNARLPLLRDFLPQFFNDSTD